jgi:hypothetical protein
LATEDLVVEQVKAILLPLALRIVAEGVQLEK